MEKYYAVTAMILLTVILVLTIRKQNGDIALLLGLLGCCMGVIVAVGFLSPVISFIRKLQHMSNVDNEMIRILIKITGVAFTGEISSTVCVDAGNAALAKVMQMISTVVILYISLPMLEALIDLVERILVAL